MLRRTTAVACLVSSLGVGAGATVRDPGACAGECEHPIGYSVDSRFDSEERAFIDEAMSVWQEGTGGRVCFRPGGSDLFIEKLDRSDQLQPWDPDWTHHVALTKGG
ncbi:MAG TPA: hypothetical protein VGY54_25850, partial [Polyangiaceae bacterium]|nr:hypothetical protein [Polyangiaceae bacterium]